MKAIKTYTPFILFFLGLFICQGQNANQRKLHAKGKGKLLGVIAKKDMTATEHAQWFNEQYERYKVDLETITNLKSQLGAYHILAFMGSWCGDSRREVPRFYKILEATHYPMEQLRMIAVDNSREHYKKSPTGEEKGYDIIKVPTFILLKDGKEVNRIVEYPKKSLEKDLLAIVLNTSYIPNYKIKPID